MPIFSERYENRSLFLSYPQANEQTPKNVTTTLKEHQNGRDPRTLQADQAPIEQTPLPKEPPSLLTEITAIKARAASTSPASGLDAAIEKNLLRQAIERKALVVLGRRS